MRCRGCNRDIEVRWFQPEGCDAPILEDLCSTCKSWSSCVVRSLSSDEEEPVVYWPKKVGLGKDLMEAVYDSPPSSGVYAVNVDTGKHASVLTGDKDWHLYGRDSHEEDEA
jgi:hypothetical protein